MHPSLDNPPRVMFHAEVSEGKGSSFAYVPDELKGMADGKTSGAKRAATGGIEGIEEVGPAPTRRRTRALTMVEVPSPRSSPRRTVHRPATPKPQEAPVATPPKQSPSTPGKAPDEEEVPTPAEVLKGAIRMTNPGWGRIYARSATQEAHPFKASEVAVIYGRLDLMHSKDELDKLFRQPVAMTSITLHPVNADISLGATNPHELVVPVQARLVLDVPVLDLYIHRTQVGQVGVNTPGMFMTVDLLEGGQSRPRSRMDNIKQPLWTADIVSQGITHTNTDGSHTMMIPGVLSCALTSKCLIVGIEPGRIFENHFGQGGSPGPTWYADHEADQVALVDNGTGIAWLHAGRVWVASKKDENTTWVQERTGIPIDRIIEMPSSIAKRGLALVMRGRLLDIDFKPICQATGALACCMTPDGKIMTAHVDGRIRMWDKTGPAVYEATIIGTEKTTMMTFASRSHLLLGGTHGLTMVIMDKGLPCRMCGYTGIKPRCHGCLGEGGKHILDVVPCPCRAGAGGTTHTQACTLCKGTGKFKKFRYDPCAHCSGMSKVDCVGCKELLA